MTSISIFSCYHQAVPCIRKFFFRLNTVHLASFIPAYFSVPEITHQCFSAFHVGSLQTSEGVYRVPLCFSSLCCRGETMQILSLLSRTLCLDCSDSDSLFFKIPSHTRVTYTVFYPRSLSLSRKIKEHSTDSHSHLNVLPVHHMPCSSW